MDLFTLGLLQKNLSGNKGDIKSKNGESSYTITDAVDFPVLGLNLYGKSVQDGVPSPEAPVDIVSVGDNGSMEVTVCGKNLFDYRLFNSYTTNGVTFTNNNDGTFTFSGSKTDLTKTFLCYKQYTHEESIALIKAAGTYKISCDLGYNENLYVYIITYYNGNNSKESANTSSTVERSRITITDTMLAYDDFRFTIGFYSPENKNIVTGTHYLQFEKGENATEFEPYKSITANITTALPLCGIPVTSGGNYTDKNGQQWICDELVYNADGTGKIVKKIGRIIFDGSEGWDKSGIETIDRYILRRISTITGARITSGLCNTYAVDVSETHNEELGKILLYPTYYDQISVNFAEYGTSTVETFKDYLKNNPIVLYTDLIEPQEIELTAAEMSALRQLMTYSGTTNISNSDNAEMDVKYCINQVMADYYPIFAGQGADVQPLVLFQGTDEGYSLADGFTGFSVYYTDTLPTEEERITISQICADDSTTESRYGYLISKIKSINNSDYNYTDSAVISSNEMVDLTNYKTLCIDFYGLASYNTIAGDEKDNISNSAYFRIDRPDTLPQSHISYDWTGWDNMGMYYRNHNKYYFDVSQISGAHYLCFGIFHGNYSEHYLNGIKIYKITLL